MDARKQLIHQALVAEIERQAESDMAELDLVAMAVAVDKALGGDGLMPDAAADDSRTPAELNAANDI